MREKQNHWRRYHNKSVRILKAVAVVVAPVVLLYDDGVVVVAAAGQLASFWPQLDFYRISGVEVKQAESLSIFSHFHQQWPSVKQK